MSAKTDLYRQTYNEFSAPGMDAIQQREKEIYGNQEPLSWATAISWEMGGDDPLQSVDCFNSEKQTPHLHYISCGFSNLFYDEAFAENEYSGYGFELSFRHLPVAGDPPNPQWPAVFLQNIARYVFSTNNIFEEYHFMNANGPLRLGTDSAITAILFYTDPEMGDIGTPHGRVKFLQVFGITAGELEAIEKGNMRVEALVEQQKANNPLLITDLSRK